MEMIQKDRAPWLARLFIGLVLLFNVQCALAFLLAPETYAPGFEMSGAAGAGIVRGMGILFLMWNVPYAVAVTDPVRRRLSLLEALTMQAIGFAGEVILLVTFPRGHLMIQATLRRFILFDGLGLLALFLAAWLARNNSSHANLQPR
jgi:hypothetical protein